MRELKRALRRELIERRRAMDKAAKNAADEDIFMQLKPLLDKAGSVFTYASTEIEVDTRRVIAYCLDKKIPVALPVSGDTELSFYHINSVSELKKGRFGIDEPPTDSPALADESTLCVVPALCADGSGLRLGYGRGYYDRFLSGFVGKSVVICYRAFKREVPAEPHDKRTDFTIFDRQLTEVV
ncbi:MAG: 5-formyltetrahydrofolate cyclo-ligase [Lachnospiraceae bacterium]|nr:5-formyltetrahydrofolate cyclo-ligase [Ruminococcus sp.]MCM1274010.1 5-formyltetrahydrofolate cyclo-ligase [Lachnospiraceae bacterium]